MVSTISVQNSDEKKKEALQNMLNDCSCDLIYLIPLFSF